MEEFSRSEMLLGKGAILQLSKKSIAVFGIGGVGSYVCEALARSGIGNLTLIDNDTVVKSNINRQLVALNSTIGRYKTEVMRERILDINPRANVKALNIFYTPQNGDEIDFDAFDYVVDSIDTVTSKLYIIEKCKSKNIPIISSMGTGNKLDPSKFIISDVYKTTTCPLARVMRRELKKRNINSLKVLWSSEDAIKPDYEDLQDTRKLSPGSVSFVPSVAGLMIAGEVVRDLIKE